MKSRTSCCKGVLLKHDIARFYPIWVLYTLMLALIFVFPMTVVTGVYDRLNMLTNYNEGIVFVNFFYALVNAQLLFGDLFSPKMCNALHAMPVRRDTFYWAHMAAGLLFAFVPDVILTFVYMALIPSFAWTAWGFLAVALGSYLFFYSLAALCCMLSGNRIGAILIYGIVNFFAVLVSWYASEIFGTMLYGVRVDDHAIMQFCPVVAMFANYLDVTLAAGSGYPNYVVEYVRFVDGFIPLAVYAGLGVVLMAAAQVAYRLRRLESAGDLLAVEKLKPAFLVTFTLTVGAFFHLFGRMVDNAIAVPFLIVGLAVGYVAGLMLVKKQMNVWKAKNFVLLGAIVGALVAGLVITALDPLGIASFVPDVEDIAGVNVYTKNINDVYYGDYDSTNMPPMEDAAHIEDALALHRFSMEHRKTIYQGNLVTQMIGLYDWRMMDGAMPTAICYTMKDGRKISRYYITPLDSEGAQYAGRLLSSVESTLYFHEKDLDSFVEGVDLIRLNQIYNLGRHEGWVITNKEEIKGLLQAYIKDCKEGTTVQYYTYQNAKGEVGQIGWIDIQMVEKKYIPTRTVYDDNPHVLQWLDDNGYHLTTPEEYDIENGYEPETVHWG